MEVRLVASSSLLYFKTSPAYHPLLPILLSWAANTRLLMVMVVLVGNFVLLGAGDNLRWLRASHYEDVEKRREIIWELCDQDFSRELQAVSKDDVNNPVEAAEPMSANITYIDYTHK